MIAFRKSHFIFQRRYLAVYSFICRFLIDALKLNYIYLEQLRALGIYSRLDQVFDAPRAVKDVLINQFALDQSVCY